MNTKELTELLNQKIEIKQPEAKPMTADDYNKTMDTFANRLNDMFKTLAPSQPTPTETTEQGETNNDKQ